jgi:DNA-binding phage protein
MDKTKISQRQKVSSSRARKPKLKGNRVDKKEQETEYVLREDAKLKEYNPLENLLDTNRMGAAIMECLLNNDTEGVLEILEGYLYAVNRTQFLKEAHVPRSTLYNFFKRRNPTIKTLAKILHASARY